MSNHAELLKLLLPPEAYDKTGVALSAELEAEGTQLDAFAAAVAAILEEIDPRTTSFLLSDFERVYGLPDECRAEVETVADRRLRLAAKIAETGGISKAYFLGLAATLGYTDVTVTNFYPAHCEMDCEMVLYDESWRFAWQVNVPGQEDIYQVFTCTSGCEDPVDLYATGPLECLFSKLKPAESTVLFNYGA